MNNYMKLVYKTAVFRCVNGGISHQQQHDLPPKPVARAVQNFRMRLLASMDTACRSMNI